MGDMPYSQRHANLFDGVIDRVNAERPAFVVHVGDITSGRGPCEDAWFEDRKRQFARIEAPFVIVPGDNDWTDCRRTGFDPMERLAKWRSLFCVPVPKLALERQRGPYCEHVRWIAGDLVFVGLNVPGGNNNLNDDPVEYGERMGAAFRWLDESAALARTRAGLVILIQANPFLKPRLGGANGYDGLLARLRRLGEEMPGRVLLVNGDTHHFRDDEPLPGVRRTEVFGWPDIRWSKLRWDGKAFAVEAMPPP